MMKILMLMLLMVSMNVSAKWTEVDVSDATGMTSYVDFGTIKRKGHKVKMWSLFDYKTVRELIDKRYLSEMRRYEYDCEEETSRQLDIYMYSMNMKQGEIVFSVKNMKEEPSSIPPESVGETVFKRTCDKK